MGRSRKIAPRIVNTPEGPVKMAGEAMERNQRKRRLRCKYSTEIEERMQNRDMETRREQRRERQEERKQTFGDSFRDQRRQRREERKQTFGDSFREQRRKEKEDYAEEQMKNQQNKDEFLEEYVQERINPKNKIFEIKIRSALMK